MKFPMPEGSIRGNGQCFEGVFEDCQIETNSYEVFPTMTVRMRVVKHYQEDTAEKTPDFVRCKDCVHKKEVGSLLFCNSFHNYTESDGFCWKGVGCNG